MRCTYLQPVLIDEDGRGRPTFLNYDNKHLANAELPCGRCKSCRINKTRDWTARLVHESRYHVDQIFLTLTYNNENLPLDGSLHKEHPIKFIRALRDKTKAKIRYYLVGEYGDTTGRPHYHIILFGWKPSDAVFYKNNLWISPTIEKIWGKGWAPFGDVTEKSCKYVASYVQKKITGKAADEHYLRYDSDNKPYQLQPEFSTMSRMPGIGERWLNEHMEELITRDFFIINEKKYLTPLYYMRKIANRYPGRYRFIKALRAHTAEESAAGITSGEYLRRDSAQIAILATNEKLYKGKY